jgi:hypothetical protein
MLVETHASRMLMLVLMMKLSGVRETLNKAASCNAVRTMWTLS